MNKTKLLIAVFSLWASVCFGQDTSEWFKSGERAAAEKKYDSAKYFFNQYIKFEPGVKSKALAHLELALIESQLKNIKAGLEEIDKAISLDKTQFIFYHYRGRLNYQNKNSKQAIRDYDLALKINPKHGSSYALRGLVKYRTGKKADACSDFAKGAELNDHDATRMQTEYCQ